MRNLEHQIAQAERGGKAQLVELLLMQSQLLGKHAALDRAVELTEEAGDAGALLLRARVRSAVHRFADARKDLDAAEKLGADASEIAVRRASIMTATGRAAEAIPSLEPHAKEHPGYASLTSLASAYAAAGRFEDAERAYLDAIRDLRTTSPFPFAWVHFARGAMWSERAGDLVRAKEAYAKALHHLPQHAAANVHLAGIEAGRGEVTAASERLRPFAEDPDALALLGELERSEETLTRAASRYEDLLAKHSLAFADHAADFYLTRDPSRAWKLAQLNLENRETERSLALAIETARAAGQSAEACALIARAKAKPRTGVELRGLLTGCPEN